MKGRVELFEDNPFQIYPACGMQRRIASSHKMLNVAYIGPLIFHQRLAPILTIRTFAAALPGSWSVAANSWMNNLVKTASELKHKGKACGRSSNVLFRS
jgi:hypothetical protein